MKVEPVGPPQVASNREYIIYLYVSYISYCCESGASWASSSRKSNSSPPATDWDRPAVWEMQCNSGDDDDDHDLIIMKLNRLLKEYLDKEQCYLKYKVQTQRVETVFVSTGDLYGTDILLSTCKF